ncbi:unnamed protein product [Phytophthora lilii]|uniref:Unnamed protein product n=1 Tax=Phytophthora lilii TaxID=2077276 RepID=A0A9W6U5H9_9STRA|nr:unnamed protein product [Phytophthora lilii]
MHDLLDQAMPRLRESVPRLLEALAGSKVETVFELSARTPVGTKAMDDELSDYAQGQLVVLMVVLLVSYGSMCVLSGALIIYMRHNRHIALKGDTEASRKTLLPAFEPLLWILCVSTGMYSFYFMVALIAKSYAPNAGTVATEALSAGRHFVLELALIFMLQKSVSLPALIRSIVITVVLACYAFPFVWYTTINGEDENSSSNYWVVAIARLLLLPLYIYVAARPPARASKRTLREYCAFATMYQMLEFAFHTAFNNNDVHLGFALIYTHVLWGSLCPFFVWRLLKADTEHWRGLGQRAVGLQALFRKGNIHERVSSQGLHVLIEMHRKYIIDFSVLDIKQRIGVGSTAVVYNGLLHSKTPVAIKVYTPTSVTEDTVAEFSHEAALCGALNHPNIVKFFGMCVSPPTICLVSELCVGSLDVVALALARRQQQPRRQQFLLNLGYMIDAARAVAYLHSFSPAFVHRDIKPSNFLVDVEGNVKLTDFGESRSLPKANITWEVSSLNDAKNAAAVTSSVATAGANNVGATAVSSSSSTIDAEHYQEYPESTSNSNFGREGRRAMPLTPPQEESRTAPVIAQSTARRTSPEMTVKGTVDYMAPEIINGRAGVASYGESADVYSLAITMWDILNPGAEKYPGTNNNHLRVLESVIAGTRPELDGHLHAGLAELITASWHVNARIRPTAQKIVLALERIQEEVCSVFAREMCEEMEHESSLLKSNGNGNMSKSFSGEQAARKMQDIDAVASVGEGIRLGNMFMNAGFLHHLKHSQPFKSSDDMYYFDEENINLCQPFAVLEGHTCRSGNGSNSAARRPGSTLGAPLPSQLVQSPGWFKSLQRQHQPSDPTPLATTSTSVKDSKSSDWDANTASDSPHDSDTAFVDAASNGTSETEECACRKLGERPNIRKPARHRFRRKYRAIPEDNILTANLLQEEDPTSTQDRHLLDEFDAGPTNVLLHN